MTAEPFPTDPETLDLLAAASGINGITGALDLLSGYDPSTLTDPDGIDVPPAGWRRWDRDQVIAALIAEVRHLRSTARSFAADDQPAPSTHPYRLVALSAAVGAGCGAVVGWLAAGRRG